MASLNVAETLGARSWHLLAILRVSEPQETLQDKRFPVFPVFCVPER